MKTRFWMCGALSLATSAFAEAKPVRKAASPPELSFQVFAYGEPWLPLTVLAKHAAKTSKNSRQRLRVSWGYAGPHNGDEGTAIYDGKQQVLWVEYSSFGIDEDERTIQQNRSIQRWRFSRVTPARMQRLIDKYRGRTPERDSQPAYLPRLIEVGCRRRVLLNRQTSWREKWAKVGKNSVLKRIP